MPKKRSRPSKAQATVSAGKAKTIKRLEISAVQVKSGMRISVMPGARRLMMVTMKLMPASVEPTPLISSAQIQ